MMKTNQTPNDDVDNLFPALPKRPRLHDIRSSINTSSFDGYLKLMKTAYRMALCLSMPHSQFSVLIKCQRENGVRLIDGKSNKSAGL